MKPSRGAGFTLVELLIAIAVLGVIATFALSKVLNSVDTSAHNVKLKEAFSVIISLSYQGFASREMKSNLSYIIDRLNIVKRCSSNSISQGCYTAANPTGMAFNERDELGFILPSGVAGIGLNDQGGATNGFFLDANGDSGPNVVGVDVLVLRYDPSTGRINVDSAGSNFNSSAYRNANTALGRAIFAD